MQNMNRMYQNTSYRNEDDDDTQLDEPAVDGNTSDTDPDENLSVEELNWKKRYSDLRSHTDKKFNDLTKQVQSLQTQLRDANKEKMPSTPEEIQQFSQQYPDIVRHFKTIAMQEAMKQHDDIEIKIQAAKEELGELSREKAEAKIRSRHPDYDDLKKSQEFHDWANSKPLSIQNLVFASDDPDDCIEALDLYKAYLNTQKKKPGPKPRDAATLVNPRGQVSVGDDNNADTKIWTASEIKRLKPREYERIEAQILKAREDGRLDLSR